ncbi:MAG TPA: hypothetical protein VFB75_17910, partial [Burkholderiales bacterium]|nr:hypothetical protein [Burkholderiales bacterium]
MTTPTFTGYGLRDVAFSEVPADVARESVFAWYESFPKTGRVAFVDNSLLARVHALLQPENDVSRCTAEGMVALNTWLHAVVLYDHVVHLANPQVPDDAWTSNTALSGAMRAIDTDISLGARIGRGRYPGLHSYLEILLRGHGAQLRAMLADADAKRCLWDCWAAAFGTQQVNGVARLGW